MIIILRSLLSGDMVQIIGGLLASLVVILTALPIHEVAHGWVANKLGDPTAKNMGRLDLNPIKHFDPIGTTALIFLGFGWAKPVPVNPYNFKNRKNGMAITALAGPVSNILLATVFHAIYKCLYYFAPSHSKFVVILLMVIGMIVQINLILAAFNLIPIPPLDGSKIIAIFMPMHVYSRMENWFARYQQYFMYGLIAVIFILPAVGGPDIIRVPLTFLQILLYNLIDFLTGFIDIIARLIL